MHFQHLLQGLALAVAMTAGVTQAQTRTWGFDRDTTLERSNPGLSDSLRLINNASEALSFDSIRIEAIRPLMLDTLRLSFNQPTRSHSTTKIGGNSSFTNKEFLTVSPNASLRLHGFTVEGGLVPVAKRAAPSVGDSLTLRLIFVAAAGRGRDTLVLVGKQDYPGRGSSLKSMRFTQDVAGRVILFNGAGIRLYDSHGRGYNLSGKQIFDTNP